MRISFLFFLLFAAQLSSGQSISVQKNRIDSTVAVIDSDKSQKLNNAIITQVSKRLVPMQYQWWTKSRKITKIVRSFKMNNDSLKQTFYFKDYQLVYSTESIKTYYNEKDKTDLILWGGTYYFNKCKLIDLVTLGHGKSEDDQWDPQSEVLKNCRNAKNDIQKYLAKKRGS